MVARDLRHEGPAAGSKLGWLKTIFEFLWNNYPLRQKAFKTYAPDWERARIGRPNFIEEPKISDKLLRYVVSYYFRDTFLPYYSPLFLCN